MNGTTSTATYPPLPRSSNRSRPANYHDQPARPHAQSRPAIDTSVPTTYSYVHQVPPASMTPSSSHFAGLQGRLASASSAASSSSSTTNLSLFSISGETATTATSAGSLAPSTSISKGYGDVLPEIEEDPQDTMRVYGMTRAIPIHKNGIGAITSQRPLSPTESLDSIGDRLHSHVLALHDFTPIAPNATCLSFRAGQIIQVLNRDTSGWWDGELEGRRGWFPSNYVSGLDQVGRLKDEVLVELHNHSRRDSTPSLASWTSGLSHSSSVFQSGTTPTQTPLMPTFDTQNSDPILAEAAPEFLTPDMDVSRSESPIQGRKSSQLRRSSSVAYDHSQQDGVERFGALSPTFSIYRAIAEGDVTSRALSPTPSFAALYHGQHPPLLTPLLHALSLLHRAVAARHQGHYQPSTACVISCVRSLLTSTECLHRDAPTLRRVPQLAHERKIILGNLGTLVSQARRCSDSPAADADEMWDGTAVREAEVEQEDWELEQMLRMGGEVLRNVTQFLEICEQNGIELPVSRRPFTHSQGSGSSGSEREMERQMRNDLGIITPTPPPTPHRRAQSGSNTTLLRTGSARGVPRNHANGDGPSPFAALHQSTTVTRLRTKSLNDLRERRRVEQAERARQIDSNPMPVPLVQDNGRAGSTRPQLRSVAHRQIHQPQLSISSTSSLSSGSIDSYGSPMTPAFPSGPCTTAQVLSALRATHDDLLSTIAAFIGHVHSHGRDSHASSKGHLIELARETVDTVRQLLTLLEAVARHPDVGVSKVETLQHAKDTLFGATNSLVEAVRELTGPVSSVSEEEERRKTLNGATGVLKVAADCVAAVKICLSRPIGEEPFIICLPSLTVAESAAVPSLPGPARLLGKRQRPVSYLRNRSISVSSLQGSEQHKLSQKPIGVVTEDSESHQDEDETVQPVDVHVKPLVEVMHETSLGRSGGSESTNTEDSDEDEPPRSSLSERSNEEGIREPLLRKDSRSTFETKLLHGDLPVPPSDTTVPPTPVSPSRSPTPLDVDSVFANVLSHEYDVRDIAYNPEGAIVGATLEVMIEKLTPHDALVDPAFHQIFMMTWRLFVSPPELVNALIGRYHLQPPAIMKDDEQEIWIRRKATPVKLRVSNLVKTWLENYWRQETDDAVLTQLSQFVRDIMALQFPAPAQRILELIRARTLSDDSIVSPRPIDRTKSVDRLREGPSAPPTPVSPSEIPRPTINKALFAALKNKSFTNIAIVDFDALELARQFTIMESKLYLLVQPEEVLELGQAGAAPAVNVKAISTLSTAITGWVTESILNESDSKKRTNLVKFFIKVADRCSSLNNYSTSRSILAALDSSTISRLHQTWAALPQKSKVQLETLRKMADHARNYSEYRSRLRNTTPPAVPFLGLYLTDVTFCREGNPSHRVSPRDSDRKLINFNKYHKLARIVQDMQRFQVPYNLKEITEVQQYLMAQFENAKNAGDLQDLYRRSLLVEPRRAADAPSGDAKPMLQIFGLGTLSRNQNLSQPLKAVITP